MPKAAPNRLRLWSFRYSAVPSVSKNFPCTHESRKFQLSFTPTTFSHCIPTVLADQNTKQKFTLSSSFTCATGFSFLLPWYDHLVARLTCEQAVKKHLIQQAGIGPQTRLLDVGCGSGTLLQLVQEQGPATGEGPSPWVGLDIDPRILKQAQVKLDSYGKQTHGRVHLVRAACDRLPFHDHSFQVVSCSLVLHHLKPEQKLSALREMRRVLSRTGKLVLADYGHPKSMLARLLFLMVQIADGWESTQPQLQGVLPNLIAEAGFQSHQETAVMSTPLGTLRCYVASP